MLMSVRSILLNFRAVCPSASYIFPVDILLHFKLNMFKTKLITSFSFSNYIPHFRKCPPLSFQLFKTGSHLFPSHFLHSTSIHNRFYLQVHIQLDSSKTFELKYVFDYETKKLIKHMRRGLGDIQTLRMELCESAVHMGLFTLY